MVTVILDSSNEFLSVAIANEERIIDKISYQAWQRQSELMIPELEKLLNRDSLDRKDISSVVVSSAGAAVSSTVVSSTAGRPTVIVLLPSENVMLSMYITYSQSFWLAHVMKPKKGLTLFSDHC